MGYQMRSSVRWGAASLAISVGIACVVRGARVEASGSAPCARLMLRASQGATDAAQCGDALLDDTNAKVSNIAAAVGGIAHTVLDAAESQRCGKPGCRFGGREARLLVVGDLVPRAWTSVRETSVDIGISSGMTALVQTTSAATAEEVLVANPSAGAQYGMGAFFEQLHELGGTPCDLAMKSNLLGRFSSAPRSAQAGVGERHVLTFLLAHELAHVTHGQDCGSGSADPLTIERACDEIAFASMPDRADAPLQIISWLVGMHHYEKLLAPVLFAAQGSSSAFTKAFPARDWTARARGLLERWRKDCASPTRGGCGSFSAFGDVADVFATIPKPGACRTVPSSADAGALNAPPTVEARRCIDIESNLLERANYNKNGRPNIVSLELPYHNGCARPVACKMKMECGTVQRTDKGDYRPFTFLERTVLFEPAATSSVTGILRWTASVERMPTVRYAHGQESESFLSCSFAGAEQKVATSSDPLCTSLSSFLAEASTGFKALRSAADGGVISSGANSTRNVPGTTNCFIYDADTINGSLLECTISDSKDTAKIDEMLAQWRTKLASCLPPPLWTRADSTPSSSLSARRASEFSRGGRFASVRIEARKALTSSGENAVELGIQATDVVPDLSPGPAFPQIEVTSWDAMLDHVFGRTTGRATSPFARLLVKQAETPRHWNEADRCYTPLFTNANSATGCEVEWTCVSRVFFEQAERDARFKQTIHTLQGKLLSGWRPRNTDDSTNWAPVSRDGVSTWLVDGPARQSIEVRVQPKDSRSVRVVFRGSAPASACAKP